MKKIAILIENLFDEKEFIYPYYRLQEEGYKVDIIGKEKNSLYTSKKGFETKSDLASKDIIADDYDALVIPGGFSPDYMRRTQATIDLVKAMNDKGKTIAAICHGPWLLISSIDLSGKTLTAYHTLKVDIENAGASYLDKDVVIDDNLVTSRNPNDLPIFVITIIKSIEHK